MDFKQLLTGNPSRSGLLYIGIGVVSLAKAIALRNDRTRFRRELLDAGLFIGVGVLLRRYGKVRDQKRAQLEESLPGWLTGSEGAGSASGGSDLADRLGRSQSAAEPSFGDRAKAIVSFR